MPKPICWSPATIKSSSTTCPKFKAKPGEAPDMQTWKGTWAPDQQNFSFQLSLNGQDKFMEATPGTQLTLKDGHNLIFDAAN